MCIMGGCIVIIFLLFVSNVAAAPPDNIHYRSDYEFNRKTNAFYKFHIEGVLVARAKEICKMEGAQLLVPKTDQEISVAHAMFKRYPDLGNYLLVDNDGRDHESVEEDALIPVPYDNVQAFGEACDVLTRTGEIEVSHCYRRLPYICKVDAKDIVYDSFCDVYASNYSYLENAGSCYKIPDYALTWNEAEAECRAEGAHLIVLNSDTEHQAIATFLKTAARVRTAVVDYFYLAGFRAERPSREFKTIFNQTLTEAGFATWQEGEPNNHDNREYCGAVFRNNGLYNDVDCNMDFAFICEKEKSKS